MRPLIALLCTTALAAESGLPLPHEGSTLATDPEVTWGRLDNGLVYAIRPNDEPPEKLSIRMYVDVGSLQEREPERGLAHYLEHMAFNGTEDYPPGTLVETLQELGAAFGSHTNAHTGFEETVYKLDLPDTEAETLEVGMHIMAEWARGMSILPEEVDKERGIILAEMRDREGPRQRMVEELYPVLYAGRRLPQRFPIGIRETVETMDAALIEAFYDAWYRPEHMVLSVVGAIDPKAVEAAIRKHFAPLAAEGEDRRFEPRSITASDGPVFFAYHDVELGDTSIYVLHLRNEALPQDGPEVRRRALLRGLGTAILGRRLTDIADDGEAAIQSGGAYTRYRYDGFTAGVSATARPGRSLEAVAVVERELRRFLEHGPTEEELRIAVAEASAGLDQAVARADNRPNAALAAALYATVRDGRVFQTPSQTRDLLHPMLEEATTGSVHAEVVDAFDAERVVVTHVGRDDLGETADARLAEAWRASRSEPVAAPEEGAATAWAYDQRPSVDAAVETSELPHDITAVQLGNGVHAAILARDERPEEVLVRLQLHIDPGPLRAGLDTFTASGFMAGGLGAHDAPELRRVLAGTTARVSGPSLATDAVVFGGGCRPDELELCFQQLRAYLTDAGWRPEPFARAKAAWLERLRADRNDLQAQFGRHLGLLTAGGYPQRRGATLPEVEWLHIAAAKAWLDPILAEAPIELAVVGDIDEAQTVELIRDYFGSLPQRPPVPVTPDLQAEGALPPIAELPRGEYRIQVDGTVARALVWVAWPTDDSADVQRARRLGLVGRAMGELVRRRIREELGEAYSPSAGHRGSTDYDGRGYLQAVAGVAPGRQDAVLAVIRELAAEIAADGFPEDVFTQVHQPTIANLEAYRHGNGYWMGSVVARSHSEPQRLAWADSMVEDYAAITKDELDALAARYLDPDRELALIAVSPGPADEESAAEGPEEAVAPQPVD